MTNANDVVWASLWMPAEQRFMTYDEVQQRRIALRDATEDACIAAYADLRPNSQEAINWGDLGCAQCGIKDNAWYVVVEEAAPNAVGLWQFVRDWLTDHGYPDVEVEVRW